MLVRQAHACLQIKDITDPVCVFAQPLVVPAAAGAAVAAGATAVALPNVTGWPPAGSPFTAAQFCAGGGMFTHGSHHWFQ
jgi:hypothetical protein